MKIKKLSSFLISKNPLMPALKSYLIIFSSILIFTLAFFAPASAQNRKKSEDVVYLKNGSIIRGEIIENQPGVSLRIRTEGKSEWVFKYDDIEKITKEEISHPQKEIFSKNKGLYGALQVGLLITQERTYFGGSGKIIADLNTNLALGYHLHRLLGIGGATGIDLIHNIAFLPLALDVRGHLLEKAVTPYYALQAGYSIPLEGDQENGMFGQTYYKYKGGFLANPALGVQISLSKDVAMLLEAGIRYQKYYTEGKDWSGEYESTHTIRRYNLRLGFVF